MHESDRQVLKISPPRIKSESDERTLAIAIGQLHNQRSIRLDLWVLGAGKRTIRLGEQRRVRDTARSHEVDGVHSSKTATGQICVDSLSVSRTPNVETHTDD